MFNEYDEVPAKEAQAPGYSCAIAYIVVLGWLYVSINNLWSFLECAKTKPSDFRNLHNAPASATGKFTGRNCLNEGYIII